MQFETAALTTLAVVSTLSAGLAAPTSPASSLAGSTLGRALVQNVLVVPAAALTLGHFVPMSTASALGLFVAAALPGGSTGPLVAALSAGDQAAAARFMILSSVIAGVLAPVLAWYLGASLPPAILFALLAIQLVPVGAGFIGRSRWPRAAERWGPRLSRLGTVLLLVMVVELVVTRGHLLRSLGLGALTAIVGTVAASLIWSPGGRRIRSSLRGITAVRNLTLALVVADVTSPGSSAALTVLVYGLVMYIFAIGVALAERRSVLAAEVSP